MRWSKIESARARIASGWYEREDVQAKLVDALYDELND